MLTRESTCPSEPQRIQTKESVMVEWKSTRVNTVAKSKLRRRAKLLVEQLEDRNLMANGHWVAYFGGMTPAVTFQDQAKLGSNWMQAYGVNSVEVLQAMDYSGAYLVKTDPSISEAQLTSTLSVVPGFAFVQDYTEPDVATIRKIQPARARFEAAYGPFDLDDFLSREKNGQIPDGSGPVDSLDGRANNNTGSTGTANFTQSETAILAFGSTVLVGFNDSGSFTGGANKFTGYARSTDGGATFVDGGTLPTSAIGDAGDPVLARNETTGRIYYSTLGFSGAGTIQMFRSDDGGASWMAPVNATPGGSTEDKQWHTVDNYPGAGNGNVYMLSRRFGAGPGIYFFRSTDHGNTFGPNGGTLITTGSQGAFITVGTDHSIYAFWFAGANILMRKSTDFGATFGAPITVASGLVGGTNGDLALTGIRQGLATPSGFRSNEFPHAAVNPSNGNIYATFANNPAGADKGDIFVVQSTNGGATWSAPVRVNDDVTTTDQWQPTLAVTPDGSKLGIFYYSRQEDAANNLFKFYGRVATISGATLTFAPSFAISDVASLPEFGRDSVVNSVYMGDYDSAVATPGAFHVIWADNRDDLTGGAPRKDPNVYYERINLGLSVSTTVPAVGTTVSSIPLDYVVNFSDPIQAGTVDVGDFAVDGINPDSFVVNTSTQVTFHYNSPPVSAQGLHIMTLPAGAILRSPDNDPLTAFSGTFRFDALTLAVVSTTPPFPNGVFTLPGPFTYDVTFNEAIDPGSVQTTDLALSGIPGAIVTGATVLAGNTTVRFTISGITTEGTLNASIAGNAITDAFGNAGTDFAANYEVDFGVVPYPTPMNAIAAFGSLVHDHNVAGRVNFVGDTDGFTLQVDQRQTMSLLLTPTSATLRPRIEVRDGNNNLIASATAAAAGQNALIQTINVFSLGSYTFTVLGADNTTGNYNLRVVLNAAIETEGVLAGAINNSIATAQVINPTLISSLTEFVASTRGAAVGTSDNSTYSGAAVSFGFEDISSTGSVIAGLTNVDDTSVSIPIGFTFPFFGVNNTTVFVSSNGLMSFGSANSSFTNTNLTTEVQALIAPFWDDLHTGGGVANSNVYSQVLGSGSTQRLIVQWNNVRFFSGGTTGDTITFQAVLFADGSVRFNYQDLVSGSATGNNGASATVGIKAAGAQGPNRLLLAFNNGPNTFVGTMQSTLISPPNPTLDYFRFTLSTGQLATVAINALTANNLNLQIRNSADVVVATGIGGATNLTKVINNFSGPAGTYYLTVAGDSNVPYNLLLTRGTAFDTEANDSFATAQTATGNRGILGALQPGGVGVYQAAAVSFNFEDISPTGTVIAGLTNVDDTSVTIPIGFTFPFYGVNHTSMGVSSNGLITFGGINSSFSNSNLTTSPALASIATFWDDLHTGGGAANSNVYSQVLGSGATQRLVVQWNQIRFFSGSTAGDTITFQAIIFADGSIRVNYLDLTSGSAAGNNGASATVGIKAAGSQGPNRLLLAFNDGPNTFVGSGKSTVISLPPPEDWYSVNLAAGQQIRLLTATPGDGVGQPVNPLDPHIELYDPFGALIASGSPFGDPRNEIITSTTALVPGNYRIRVNGQGGTSGSYFVGMTTTTAPTGSGSIGGPSFLTSGGSSTLAGLLAQGSTNRTGASTPSIFPSGNGGKVALPTRAAALIQASGKLTSYQKNADRVLAHFFEASKKSAVDDMVVSRVLTGILKTRKV
jgi:hypothetical protein